MRKPINVIILVVIPLLFLILTLFCVLKTVREPEFTDTPVVTEVASTEELYEGGDDNIDGDEVSATTEWLKYVEIDEDTSNQLTSGLKYHLKPGKYTVTLSLNATYSDLYLYDTSTDELTSADFIALPNKEFTDIEVSTDSYMTVTSSCILEVLD